MSSSRDEAQAEISHPTGATGIDVAITVDIQPSEHVGGFEQKVHELLARAARLKVTGRDWARATQRAREEMASRLVALREVKWKAYSASFYVFRANNQLSYTGVRLFHGLPTPEGLQRAFESIALENRRGGEISKGDHFVFRGSSAFLVRVQDNEIDPDVIVQIREQEILGEDGE